MRYTELIQINSFPVNQELRGWAGRGARVDSVSPYCAGGPPIESWHPTSAICIQECDQLPCWPSRGVAPEVYVRNPLCAGKETGKRGIHPGLETQDKHHQKSTTGVSRGSVAPQNRLVSSKKFLKKELRRWNSYSIASILLFINFRKVINDLGFQSKRGGWIIMRMSKFRFTLHHRAYGLDKGNFWLLVNPGRNSFSVLPAKYITMWGRVTDDLNPTSGICHRA